MAEQAISTFSTSSNSGRDDRNDRLNKYSIAGMPRISPATLPGLLQSYAIAAQVLPCLFPRPGKVKEGLEDPARRDRTIYFLQKGSTALNALKYLEDGSPDAMEHLRTLLYGLTTEFYKEAERA